MINFKIVQNSKYDTHYSYTYNTDIHLTIPEEYVGKAIEVVYYPSGEMTEPKAPGKKMSDFKQILTSEEAGNLQNYVKKSRAESFFDTNR